MPVWHAIVCTSNEDVVHTNTFMVSDWDQQLRNVHKNCSLIKAVDSWYYLFH